VEAAQRSLIHRIAGREEKKRKWCLLAKRYHGRKLVWASRKERNVRGVMADSGGGEKGGSNQMGELLRISRKNGTNVKLLNTKKGNPQPTGRQWVGGTQKGPPGKEERRKPKLLEKKKSPPTENRTVSGGKGGAKGEKPGDWKRSGKKREKEIEKNMRKKTEAVGPVEGSKQTKRGRRTSRD